MKRTQRLSVLVGAAALGLVLAVNALTATPPPKFEPQFFASAKPTPGATGVTLRMLVPLGQDAAGSIVIGVPKGFTVATTQSAGARLGTATVLVNAADIGHSFKSKGTVTVSSEAAFGGDRCAGPGKHDAVWSINTTVSGRAMKIPVYVDNVKEVGFEEFVSKTLTVCPLAGDLRRGASGRAPLGSRVLDLSFTVSTIKNPTETGIYRWRTLVTPFYPALGTLNTRAAVEVQSISPIPVALTVGAETAPSSRPSYTRVTVSGSLDAGGQGVDGAVVELYRGTTRIARLLTKRGGKFTAVGDLRKSAAGAVFIARLNQEPKDLGLGGCVATLKTRNIPCIDSTVAGYKVASKPVRVSL
jgi:hypothetical protein